MNGGQDDDDDDGGGADPRAESKEVEDFDGAERSKPKDTRLRKTGRINQRLAWAPVEQNMDKQALDEKLAHLAAIQCSGGKWVGSASESAGWKPRTEGPMDDKTIVSWVSSSS